MKPLVFIVSAASGAGKTSLIHQLMQQFDGVAMAVSHTTRKPRAGEVDGINYHFIQTARFNELLGQQAFIEHAQVFDNYYGTAQSSVDAVLKQNKHVILEIDWQGARQVREQLPEAVSIFILPPSKQALLQRLSNRATDSQAVIEKRMYASAQESAHYNEADYVIINDDFEQALAELKSIIVAESLRLDSQNEAVNSLGLW